MKYALIPLCLALGACNTIYGPYSPGLARSSPLSGRACRSPASRCRQASRRRNGIRQARSGVSTTKDSSTISGRKRSATC